MIILQLIVNGADGVNGEVAVKLVMKEKKLKPEAKQLKKHMEEHAPE